MVVSISKRQKYLHSVDCMYEAGDVYIHTYKKYNKMAVAIACIFNIFICIKIIHAHSLKSQIGL